MPSIQAADTPNSGYEACLAQRMTFCSWLSRAMRATRMCTHAHCILPSRGQKLGMSVSRAAQWSGDPSGPLISIPSRGAVYRRMYRTYAAVFVHVTTLAFVPDVQQELAHCDHHTWKAPKRPGVTQIAAFSTYPRFW